MKKDILSFLTIVGLLCVVLSSCQPNEPELPMENGYEYVDLGLSVKWANCNVGADKRHDYGDLYAWGEICPKTEYSWSTYLHGSGKDNLLKYTTSTTGESVVLEAEDDVASVLMGGAWRMPTMEEFMELRTQCTWTWAQLGETMGYYITAPNGNSIFLPANGFQDEEYHVNQNLCGYYWTSTLDATNQVCASSVDFVSGKVSIGASSRFYGQSVRAVVP